MRTQLFKLGIVILATTFSGVGVRAQQQTPDQSSQDQQKKQDQQPNSNQGAQQQQTPDQTNQDQQQQQQQAQPPQNPDQQQNPDQGAQPPQNPEENQPEQPIPAYRSPLGGTTDNEDNNGSQQYDRDTSPLSGVEDVSAGTLHGEKRSNWSPYFSALVSGQSSSLGTNTGWRSYESLIGGLNFRKVSPVSDLDLRYLGGGSFYSSSGVGDTVVQDLSITDTLHWRRNSLVLLDQFGYFPETSFGYGGGLGLPGLTTTTSIVQPGFLPGESILTRAGPRATNASLAQMDFGLSARSSITIAGGYSFLRYFDSSLFDNSDIIARAGYNYRLSREDTIALFYNFDELRYTALTATIQNHIMNVSYGRQMTGRVSFQAAAGPEISFYPLSLFGGASGNSVTRVSWSMHTALTYRQAQRTLLGLTYSHGVSGGSGIFFGAASDRVTGSLGYQPSRGSIRFSAGYAHNKGFTAPGAASSGQVYDYWFGGATFGRSVSRTWSLSLGYELQYQQSNQVFCITTPCGTSYTRNIVSFGLNWNARPIPY